MIELFLLDSLVLLILRIGKIKFAKSVHCIMQLYFHTFMVYFSISFSHVLQFPNKFNSNKITNIKLHTESFKTLYVAIVANQNCCTTYIWQEIRTVVGFLSGHFCLRCHLSTIGIVEGSMSFLLF